jgi:hypothetical protein
MPSSFSETPRATERFSSSPFADGRWTVETGGATTVFGADSGGFLATGSATSPSVLVRAGITAYGDGKVVARVNRNGDAGFSVAHTIVRKKTGVGAFLGFIWSPGTNLRIDKFAAGSGTTLTSQAYATSPSNYRDYWMVSDIVGNDCTLKLYADDPREEPDTPILAEVSHTLTSGDATAFGTGVVGGVGWRWSWGTAPGQWRVRELEWDSYLPTTRKALTSIQRAHAREVLGVHGHNITAGIPVGEGLRKARSFAEYIGRRPYTGVDFMDETNWSKVRSPQAWVEQGWENTEYNDPWRVMLGLPMLVYNNDTTTTGNDPHNGTVHGSNGTSLAAGAAGDYDTHFTELATYLDSRNITEPIFRLGWEFNGNWMKWQCGNATDAGNFATYYARIVSAIRAVLPGAQFEWCINCGNVGNFASSNTELGYPGDAYVDYIGMDIYDQAGSLIADHAARLADIKNRKHGLSWVRRFARDHGKPLVLPEWGLSYAPTTGSGGNWGGGDNSYFIREMFDFIGRHDCAYAHYWNLRGTARWLRSAPRCPLR